MHVARNLYRWIYLIHTCFCIVFPCLIFYIHANSMIIDDFSWGLLVVAGKTFLHQILQNDNFMSAFSLRTRLRDINRINMKSSSKDHSETKWSKQVMRILVCLKNQQVHSFKIWANLKHILRGVLEWIASKTNFSNSLEQIPGNHSCRTMNPLHIYLHHVQNMLT